VVRPGNGAFIPKIPAEQARELPVAQAASVNFGLAAGWLERPVPQRCEELGARAPTQAVGTLAAHPGGRGGVGDAAPVDERLEKAKLALESPAVAARFAWVGAAAG